MAAVDAEVSPWQRHAATASRDERRETRRECRGLVGVVIVYGPVVPGVEDTRTVIGSLRGQRVSVCGVSSCHIEEEEQEQNPFTDAARGCAHLKSECTGPRLREV